MWSSKYDKKHQNDPLKVLNLKNLHKINSNCVSVLRDQVSLETLLEADALSSCQPIPRHYSHTHTQNQERGGDASCSCVFEEDLKGAVCDTEESLLIFELNSQTNAPLPSALLQTHWVTHSISLSCARAPVVTYFMCLVETRLKRRYLTFWFGGTFNVMTYLHNTHTHTLLEHRMERLLTHSCVCVCVRAWAVME